jgi:hypothetical protein
LRSIPNVFQLSDKGRATGEVALGMSWALDLPCKTTRLYDGEIVLLRGNNPYKSYTRPKKGRPRKGFFPDGAETEDGQPGWIPWPPDDPDYQSIVTAMQFKKKPWRDGIYTLIGPEIRGNSERKPRPMLMRFATESIRIPGVDFDTLNIFFREVAVKGVVFTHPNGKDHAKVEGEQFGQKWPRVEVHQ